VQDLNGVSYVYARKFEAGKPTAELLAQFCLDLINGLHFPKPMRWADLDFRFARPIRWIVALFGTEVIPFEFVGLTSGRVTRGQRTLGHDIELKEPARYVEDLRQVYVMVDPEERKKVIWEQIQKLAQDVEGTVDEDAELLEEVMHIVEYPTALMGEVADRYMHLPEAVITTPMKDHQRYFPVRGQDGTLLPYFITVRNGGTHALDKVKAGNEKVLKARLEDAAFYYREDQKQSLADLVGKLEKIVYHDKLGTVRQRVERIRELARAITEQLGLGDEKKSLIDRTALLAKADLVTMMVYDFPELQGIMGAEYAALSGEPQEVAAGILEHYQPRFAGDAFPQSLTGQVVSIADKIDAIVGSFGIGLQPTGSQDPYALRRQAQGVVGILLDAGWDISLEKLFATSYESFNQQGVKLEPLAEIIPALHDFFLQRLRYVLQEQGFRYDTIDAVLSNAGDSMTRIGKKASVLSEKREAPEFTPYAQAFIRCLNLSKKAEPQALNPKDLVDPAEIALSEAISLRKERFDNLVMMGEYDKAYHVASELVPFIEKLFEAVMIMVEDEKLKQARLALLSECVEMLGCLGDLSLLA
jgi:glycyl-tRNA synthetase beta chain